MGQGLWTKMQQVASRTLGIPITKIHTSECSTDKVPNTSPTAGSSGSDLNGMAVKVKLFSRPLFYLLLFITNDVVVFEIISPQYSCKLLPQVKSSIRFPFYGPGTYVRRQVDIGSYMLKTVRISFLN